MKTFKTEGYVEIPYSSHLRSAVENMQQCWRKFCSLSKEKRKMFPYSNESAGVGYELKEQDGKFLDKKENFNFTLARYGWLIDQARKTNLVEAEELVKACRDVALEIQSEVQLFADKAESEFNLRGFKSEVTTSADIYYIRLIHYFGDRNPGDEIAAPHTDKSGFTFHLYEDTPGLQRLTYYGDWVDMQINDGKTQVIPNMQLQFRTDGDLKATCHRVIATEDSSQNGRFSAVCFVMLKNTAKYNKESEGRLQEMKPGFNYTLSPEEFSKLMK